MRTVLRSPSAARGQIVVMLAVLMVMLLGAAVLMVHLGLYFFEKARMQSNSEGPGFNAYRDDTFQGHDPIGTGKELSTATGNRPGLTPMDVEGIYISSP